MITHTDHKTSKKLLYFAKHLLRLPKGTILFTFEGLKANELAIKVVPRNITEAVQRNYKRKKIIMKGIVHDKMLNVFANADDVFIKNRLGRTTGVLLLARRNILVSAGMLFVAPRPRRLCGVLVIDKL